MVFGITEIVAFGMLGLLTSLLMGMIITEAKRPLLLLYLMLGGVFTGWLSGVLWVYLTGGLGLSLVALIIPVFVSAFFSIISIVMIPDRMWMTERFNDVGKNTALVSVALLILLIFSVGYITMTAVLSSAYNTQELDFGELEWTSSEIILDENSVSNIAEEKEGFVDMQVAKTAFNGLKLMEDPSKGEYINFRTTFSVAEDSQYTWNKPYVKIAVFKDKDKNKQLSSGDVLWSDLNIKLDTENNNWVLNCLWENNQPKYAIYSAQDTLLPIFHVNRISEWKDDSGKTFLNTPDGLSAGKDMLSWELVDGKIELKEAINSYASLDVGEETTIEGKIYCSAYESGDHYVYIQAFDADVTDPTDETAEPVAVKAIPFSIHEDTGGIGQEWLILGFLAVIAIAGFIVLRKQRM